MGICVSAAGGITEEEKVRHREAERQMREQKMKLDNQVKVSLSIYSLLDCRGHSHPLPALYLGSSVGFWRLWKVNCPQSESLFIDSLMIRLENGRALSPHPNYSSLMPSTLR